MMLLLTDTQKKMRNYINKQELFDGLLLLAQLHPKGKVSVDNDQVTFYILVEDSFGVTEADEKQLNDWGWVFIEDKEIQLWVYEYE